MKPGDDLYSLDDLEKAVHDLSHHKGALKGIQDQLKSKRDAIKSFEQDEAVAQARVDDAAAKVHKIAAKLRR